MWIHRLVSTFIIHICHENNKWIFQGNAAITKCSPPESPNKERWETHKDNTNATYENTDAQTKKNSNSGPALTRSVGKPLWWLNQFYSRYSLDEKKTLPTDTMEESTDNTLASVGQSSPLDALFEENKWQTACPVL